MINEENYSDAAQELHWWCVHNHSGSTSELYSIMCQLNYRPGPLENGPDGNFYTDMLKSGEIDPASLLELIHLTLQGDG